MGWIKIKIEANDKNTQVDIKSNNTTVSNLSNAIAQLELTKLNLLSQVAKLNKATI